MVDYIDTIDQNVDPIEEPTGITAHAGNKNQEIIPGNSVTFRVQIKNINSELLDPEEISFDVHRNPLSPMTKFFLLSGGEISKTSDGNYEITLLIPDFLVPGVYTSRWQITEGQEKIYAYEQFSVVDPPFEPVTETDPPVIHGIIRESLEFNDLGRGNTDTLCLVGHADGISVNDPYAVVDMQDAINRLQADTSSPLVRALLEAYHNGCRDIYLVAAAPMREYQSDLQERFTSREEWGDRNFYERYAQRLQETYRTLSEFDLFDVVVPIEAPFYDAQGVDFFTPLASFCLDTFINTAQPVLGVIGTRFTSFDQSDIDILKEDPRTNALKTDEELQYAGKFVMIVLGEAVIKTPHLTIINSGSLAVSAASFLCANPLVRGLTYSTLPSIYDMKGTDLVKSQIKELTNISINPGIRKTRGKRGEPYNAVLATDNTSAPDGSDYWSIVQMRLVSRVIRDIKVLGSRSIGTTTIASLDNDIRIYFESLRIRGYLRDFTFKLSLDQLVRGAGLIDIILYPYFGLREISFIVNVGTNKPFTLSSTYAESNQINRDDLLSVEISNDIVIIS